MPKQMLIEHALANPRLRASFGQLVDAHSSALSLRHDPWALAVEIADLLDVGCTKTLLRLLVGAEYLQHAEDITRRSDPIRIFRPECPMKFGPHTCFIVTDAGVQFFKDLFPASDADAGNIRQDPPHTQVTVRLTFAPCWDPATREFSVGSQLLKRFSRPAPMLDLVLSSFQELAWPPRLDDPLPPVPGLVSAERLRDTIRRLNRCQNPHTVRFSSDGLGTGIRWAWTPGRAINHA